VPLFFVWTERSIVFTIHALAVDISISDNIFIIIPIPKEKWSCAIAPDSTSYIISCIVNNNRFGSVPFYRMSAEESWNLWNYLPALSVERVILLRKMDCASVNTAALST